MKWPAEAGPDESSDRLCRIAPPSDLAPLVEAFAGRRALGDRVMFPVFPTARAELMFHFADQFQLGDTPDGPLRDLPRAGLLGPRRTVYWQCAGPRIDWFLIQLTALGCRHVLGIRFGEAWNREIPLELLWGGAAGALHDRLRGAASFEGRVAKAVEILRGAKALDGDDALSAAGTAARGGQVRRIGQLNARLGIGSRRLHQLFVAEYGVAPKAFLTLMRFGRHLEARHPLCADPGRLAGEPEYADESHAIREFKRFTGLTPGAYVTAKRGDRLVYTGPKIVLEALG